MKATNQTGRKKVQVSFVIRDAEEKRHRSGISSLQIDSYNGRLYTAGRDSIIRVWNKDKYVRSMEHHTDWVNDIVVCCGGNNLISASSDTTVKVWNAVRGFCMSTLRTHKDYVKALAYAKEKEHVASAGLDKAIFLWDINKLTALTASNNTVTTSSLSGNNESIYSLAMDPCGTIIISGSTERVLRTWDPRTCNKMFKLIGHTDNVKALIVSNDAKQAISGSSDGTIKLWSLGEQRCVQTLRPHEGAVWAVLANDTFTHVLSGGRDQQVYLTDLKNPTVNTLVCSEKAPVLKLSYSSDQQAVWVATESSDLNCYKIPKITLSSSNDYYEGDPNNSELFPSPMHYIQGGPKLVRFTVLNDKRHILTKDSDENVALYDVLKAVKVKDLGKVNYEDELKHRFKMVYIPNWFNADVKTGMLTINLGQDETDCFGAWVSAREAGLADSVEPDQKVNYGRIMRQALLHRWRNFEPDCDTHGKLLVTVPAHTPLIISEISGRTLYRLLVNDISGESECLLLNDTIPLWLSAKEDINDQQRFIKVSFFLFPYPGPSSSLKQEPAAKKDRLAANDFLQCRKVAEHVVEKILRVSPTGGEGESTPPANNNSTTNPQVELLCNDQVLDPSMDLRTVKHFIWKSTADLTLYYRTVK